MPDKEKKTPAKKASAKAAPKADAAAENAGPTCRHENCKQPVRAKGYCRRHFQGWRRGEIGAKHRYSICSKEACRKKAEFAGRCAEHRKNAPAAEAAA